MPDLDPSAAGGTLDAEQLRQLILQRLMRGGAAAGLPGGTTTPEQATGGAQPAMKPGATAAAMNTGAPGEPSAQPPTTTPPPAEPFGAAGKAPGAPGLPIVSGAIRPAPAPILSEQEYGQQFPAPKPAPYQAPDLKHRLLMGLFGGMQEFGRPGQGAETIRNYVADIARRADEAKAQETAYPNLQHAAYERYIQGQKGPLDIEELRARITESQGRAQKQEDQQTLQQLYTEAVRDGNTANAQKYLGAYRELQQKPERGQPTPYGDWREQNPNAPVKDWLTAEATARRAGERPERETPYDTWRRQNPKAPLADWFKVSGEGRAGAATTKHLESLYRMRDRIRESFDKRLGDIRTDPAEVEGIKAERDRELANYDAEIRESRGGGQDRPTATDAQGNKVEWDGSTWVPIPKSTPKAATTHKEGDLVEYQGKQMRIAKILPDGRLQLEPAEAQPK